MTRVQSFAPVETRDAQVLILGSMPGVASLTAGRYYAHPRNAFWPIMSELLHLDGASRYEAKLRALRSARIALWDVLRSCTRRGSLDSSIENAALVPNDFEAFFRSHRRISAVFFNGAKAEACYRRHVLPVLDAGAHPISYVRLPSTSPANASLSFDAKLAAWQAVLKPQPPGSRRSGARGLGRSAARQD